MDTSTAALTRATHRHRPLARLLGGLLLALLIGLYGGDVAGADADAGPGPGAVPAILQVRQIFEARCAACHMAEPPEGASRGVTKASHEWAGPSAMADLAELIEGLGAHIAEPNETELMQILKDPEDPMPPPSSRSGPLSAVEMDIVTRWVAAGAPGLKDVAAAPPDAAPDAAPGAGAPAGYDATDHGDQATDAATPTDHADHDPEHEHSAPVASVAPSTSAATTAAPPLDTETTVMLWHLTAVLQDKCGMCHQDAPSATASRGVVSASRKWSGSANLIGLHNFIDGAGAPITDPAATELVQILESTNEPMPPKKALTGPLSDTEKALIIDWVRAGAPVGSLSLDTIAAPQATTANRAWVLIGKLHPVVVHFPIALILVAFLVELYALVRSDDRLVRVVEVCLVVGAVGAVVAASLGWIAADSYSGSLGETLQQHRQLGVITAILSVISATLYMSADASKRDKLFWLSRGVLLLIALLVGATGHLGGSLVYGLNYFSF